MYSQIAIDSVIVYPSMSKTGTCCIGFIAVISSPFCSPLRRLTALYSKSRPLRLRTILSLQELPERQYPWRAIFGLGLVEKQESSTAGNTFPLQSPNPIVYPFPWQKPIKLISSPFYKNFLTSPVGKSIGSVPFQQISSKDPNPLFSGAEMVPDPSISPAFKLQPVTAW